MKFDDISRRVKKFGKDTATEVQKMNEVRQLNAKVSAEKKRIKSLYAELGRKLYDMYKEEPLQGFESELRAIGAEFAAIDLLKTQIRKVKGVALCPCCSAEVSVTERFCPNCGSKMPEVFTIEDAGKNAAPEVETGHEPAYDAADKNVIDGEYREAAEEPEEPDAEAETVPEETEVEPEEPGAETETAPEETEVEAEEPGAEAETVPEETEVEPEEPGTEAEAVSSEAAEEPDAEAEAVPEEPGAEAVPEEPEAEAEPKVAEEIGEVAGEPDVEPGTAEAAGEPDAQPVAAAAGAATAENEAESAPDEAKSAERPEMEIEESVDES